MLTHAVDSCSKLPGYLRLELSATSRIPAQRINKLPMSSLMPNVSFAQSAALRVPNINSERISILNKPVLICVGAQLMIALVGMKKKMLNSNNAGITPSQVEPAGNCPRCSASRYD